MVSSFKPPPWDFLKVRSSKLYCLRNGGTRPIYYLLESVSSGIALVGKLTATVEMVCIYAVQGGNHQPPVAEHDLWLVQVRNCMLNFN